MTFSTASIKIPWRLIAFGVVSYLLFLLINLPAHIVTSRLQKRVLAVGVTGTIWDGKAVALQFGGISCGAVTWHINAWRLVTGKLSLDLRATRDDSSLQGTIDFGFERRVGLHALRGVLPIASLGGFALPGGWQGNLRLDLADLELENSWPVRARGALDVENLIGPANHPMQIGNFKVEFNGSESRDGLVGVLTSVGDGPFDVTGSLRLLPNRSYNVDAQVATKPGAPQSIANGLQYLGPPDAQGRRSLSMSGTL